MAEKEYIEREAVINHIDFVVDNATDTDYQKAAWGFGIFVSRLPAADVAPVKHGHWNVGYFHDRVCSCCTHPSNNLDDYPYKFCPHCGAKMDGGAENAKHTGNNDNLP